MKNDILTMKVLIQSKNMIHPQSLGLDGWIPMQILGLIAFAPLPYCGNMHTETLY